MRAIRLTPIGPLLLLLLLVVASSGCAALVYRSTQTGTFSGKLDVRWIKPNRFVYVPAADDPLQFVTSDMKTIKPRLMYTDGGSVPPVFWGVPGLSPWGYAPAYIIHDWLFMAKHCGDQSQLVSFEDSARILGEGIKTLMVAKVAPESPITMYLIVEAVRSPIARDLWERGRCEIAPPDAPMDADVAAAPLLMTIDIKNLPPMPPRR